ncbi:MAG: sugar transferase [Lachnospiraceae bacterium]|nr:sugar transferase [Lachnospiraceae bacterium]
MYPRYIKRLLDILLGMAVIILFWWLYLLIALLVLVFMGRPVIFLQKRPGYHEKIFGIMKFRTMKDLKDSEGRLLPDKDRLTGFGLFLRKTSLDELPEIFNILKGEMSLVGPRPLLEEYLPWYSEREKLRHIVRPGLTGLAQASGRNFLDWDKRLELDAEYAENISFGLDMKILWMTLKQVLGHSETVAGDTSAAEGNLAAIRKARKEADKHE